MKMLKLFTYAHSTTTITTTPTTTITFFIEKTQTDMRYTVYTTMY